MSGGSYGYIYCRLEDECKGRMCDAEMDDLINDLCKVLHDLEWWQSSDTEEATYRKTLKAFKKKWFEEAREERLCKYIDEKVRATRKELYELIGLGSKDKVQAVIDEIEEEIKDTLYVDSLIFTELIDFKNGKIDADDVIEEFNRVTRIEVLKIIDKYRAESEDKE